MGKPRPSRAEKDASRDPRRLEAHFLRAESQGRHGSPAASPAALTTRGEDSRQRSLNSRPGSPLQQPGSTPAWVQDHSSRLRARAGLPSGQLGRVT